MGTTVTVTLDGQLKPDYTIATVLAPAFAVDVDELVLWIGNDHGAGYSFEVTGIRKCLDKIRDFDGPTLIIHAEQDHIIPFSDGQALYEACQSAEKTFLIIPGANHNDIFMRGMSEYMTAVKRLMSLTSL